MSGVTEWLVLLAPFSGGYIYADSRIFPLSRYNPLRGLRPIYKIRVTMK